MGVGFSHIRNVRQGKITRPRRKATVNKSIGNATSAFARFNCASSARIASGHFSANSANGTGNMAEGGAAVRGDDPTDSGGRADALLAAGRQRRGERTVRQRPRETLRAAPTADWKPAWQRARTPPGRPQTDREFD